ncbi:DMT family transporter [Carboxydocella sp. JDF658]|uniref:DMT family transporter n=1 Tax=Carboxydocella sp. JDF658 TaxID=1926600 RepID=UPI0009AE15FA|nr:DMT family transporter [Carboxydocella sp. JDF658]GAW32473.1 hypothetical protein JDF658_22380 [Carboxydocella sp. JDF658]
MITNQHLKGAFMVVLAAGLWGFSGTVAKYFFNKQVDPLILVQIRLNLSAWLLLAWLSIKQRQLLKIERQDYGKIIILGILGMAGVQFTYLYTVSRVNVALAVFLQYLSPVLVSLYAWVWQKQLPDFRGLLALILAITGSALMIMGPELSLEGIPLDGLLTGLASAVTAAFYTVYGKQVLQKYTPWTTLGWALLAGGLPWWLINSPRRLLAQVNSVETVAFFIYIALFATIIPFGLYFAGLKRISATETVIISMLEPVVAALTAFWFLGERLSLSQIGGGLAIMLAVAILSSGSISIAQESRVEER